MNSNNPAADWREALMVPADFSAEDVFGWFRRESVSRPTLTLAGWMQESDPAGGTWGAGGVYYNWSACAEALQKELLPAWYDATEGAINCPHCQNTRLCPHCGGDGLVFDPSPNEEGNLMTCPSCGGAKYCHYC